MKSLSQCEKDVKVSPELQFPGTPFFTGPEAPCRFEAEVYNCNIRGSIPKSIDGTYYRVMPDPGWAPLYQDDVFINGDGSINAVRIQNGHADFKSRFVRTEKFCIERAARQSVFGKYRNRYTDDPRVKHEIHSTANTHVIHYENQLLALKEDSRPYALDPDTLKTKGYYDFHGQYTAPTHTAHPKIDMATGEMLEKGHKHFAWDEEKPLYFGVLPPRNPKPEDIRWFHYKNAFFGHVGNAFDGNDGCVYLDAPLTYGNKVIFDISH
jgi:carotenoid cleavage dioxygenase-like enzyme